MHVQDPCDSNIMGGHRLPCILTCIYCFLIMMLKGQSVFFVNLFFKSFFKFKFLTIVVLETTSANFRSLR